VILGAENEQLFFGSSSSRLGVRQTRRNRSSRRA
jgi:hypothetical protein